MRSRLDIINNRRLIGTISLAAMVAAMPALVAQQTLAAQQNNDSGQTGNAAKAEMNIDRKANGNTAPGDGWIDIATWDTDAIYNGWSATDLLDEEVSGANGEEVGEIEDVIISKTGEIKAVVVEGGGFLDIGDTHARIAWDNVTFRDGSIFVPYREEAFEDGALVGVDDMPAKAGYYRVRELIGDTIRDRDGVAYGIVRDVIFSKNGKAEAVLVRPGMAYGYTGTHAVPYSAADYDPYQPDYWVPYQVKDLT